MNVTKQQILQGVIQYAKSEIVNRITDKPVKMIFAAGVKSLELMPSLSDKVFENPLLSVFLHEENGMYNLDDAFHVLTETMNEYGDFPITIPIVKTPLVFNNNDIILLKQYIENNVQRGVEV